MPPMEEPNRRATNKHPLKQVTRRLRPLLGSLAIRSLGYLPLSLARPLGAVVGGLGYRAAPRTRQISRENVRRCLPGLTPPERERLVKESLRHTAITAAEAPAIWTQPWARLKHWVVGLEGFDLLQEQQATGRGLLLLAPHLGNWEIMGPVMPRHLQDITFMFQPTGMEAIDRLMIEGRSRHGVKLAPTTRKGVSQVLKALQRGEAVAILPDQVPERGAGQVAEFFGRPAYTMTLVHKLIQRTGCDVLMVYAKRVAGGFQLVMREADAAIADRRASVSLEALNRSVEACVREVPEQYQWEYKRFKSVD